MGNWYMENGRVERSFLNRKIHLNKEHAKDPVTLMYIVFIEYAEMRNGDGMAMMRYMKDNYKLTLADDTVIEQITNILNSRTK